MKGLLVTIGDSWTIGTGSSEGVAYGNYVADALNYELVNLGIGGNSNSGAVKTLLKKEYENLKEKYDDVIVIFLLTDPIRFSFFSKNYIRNFSISHNSVFFNWYVKEVVQNLKIDPALETVFFLKMVEYFCKLYGYRFYYASAFNSIEDISILYQTDGLLLPSGSFKHMLSKEEIAPCGHPNDDGYKKIANYILKNI